MPGAGLRELLLEQPGVDAHRIQTKGIAVGAGLDRVGAEDAAKLSHIGAQNRICRSRGPVSPQAVNKPAGADHLPYVDRQQGKQSGRLGARQPDPAPIAPHLDPGPAIAPAGR